MDQTIQTMNLATRSAILMIRDDDKSFWDKYKWYIVGGLVAIPIQLVMLWFYLRWRKAKKLRALDKGPENGTLHMNSR
ncbi:hypothetical protein PVAG01_04356 [Phlyctema vagabunda]|uniref:ATP synthase F0 subunit 8 n=1 Tax=Phlyctema vagabunda TaxID=108571 RepID=A0ABR4PP64_9HELO